MATYRDRDAMTGDKHHESVDAASQDQQDQTAALLAAMPFSAWCGIVLSEASADAVTGSLAWIPERCTSGGVMHGGAIMALADSVGGACAFLNLPAGASTSTIESKTNFFRAVRGGEVRAVARPLHVGRTILVIQTDIRDDQDRRVALVTQSQVVLA
jgi:1,4-dihydroxy-2-naphthoyl-CoA hydrolase